MILEQPMWFWILAAICIITLIVTDIQTRRDAKRKSEELSKGSKP